ncbi:MAG: GAF domain-containing SpoIIE family protein phosphatase [Acidobacteriota bacterium]
MRVLPRFTLPNFRQLRHKLRRAKRHLTVARALFGCELALFIIASAFIFTGSRAAWIDGLGRRADLLIGAAAFVGFALIHQLARRYLLPQLERYFSPVKYDDRRILFDLGQEARAATDIAHLFSLIVEQIGEALRAEDVSIFVRDEKAGDYQLRVSSSHGSLKPEDVPDSTLSRDAFVIRRLRSVSQPLEISEQDFDAWARALESAPSAQREARQKEQGLLTQLQSRLLQPIRSKDQLVGVLSLGQCRVRHEYNATDKEMLMSVASQLALVIENARLTERMLADERLRRELALAAEVQKRLLPTLPPECVSVELAGFCQPARGVGGDYYDFFKFDNQQLGIAIADVAGKGIAAALLMSTVQATLRGLSTESPNYLNESNESLANMVATLNRLLVNSTGGANYVTFFYAQFDQSTQQLAYVNAGHNPPFLFRANEDGLQTVLATSVNGFKKLDAGGMFVGMFDHLSYEQELIQMQSGDVLIAFTDGLPEAQNNDGEDFDDERIQRILAETALLPVNEIRDEILRRVKDWCEGAPQYDDLTFLVLKVK